MFTSIDRVLQDLSQQVSKLEAGNRDLSRQLEELKSKSKRLNSKAKVGSQCDCGSLRSRVVSLLKSAGRFGSKEEFVAMLSDVVAGDARSTSMDDLLRAQAAHPNLRRNSSHLEAQTQDNNKSSSVLYQFLQRMPSNTVSGRELVAHAQNSTQRAVHLTGKSSSGFSAQSLGSGRSPGGPRRKEDDSLSEWVGREGIRLPAPYEYSNKHSKYASRSLNFSKRENRLMDSTERLNVQRLEVRSALQIAGFRSSLSLPKHHFDTQPNHSHSEHFEASSNQTISLSYNRHPVARRPDLKLAS